MKTVDRRILQLGKKTISYGFGGILGKSLNIFLLPVLTRLFTLDQYGTIDLISLIITFFNAVCILGMDSAIGVYYFEQKNERDRKDFFASYFWAATASALAFSILSFLLAPIISHMVLKDATLLTTLRVACLTIPATVIFQALISLARFRFKPTTYNLLLVLNVGLNVLLAILLVKYFGLHITGVFWAKAGAGGVTILVGLFSTSDYISFKPDFKKIRKLTSYGIPLIPLAVISYLSGGMGRYFLKFFWSDTEIGVYSFALKLSGLAGIAFTAFNLAFLPYASKLRFEEHFNETIDSMVRLFLFAAGGIILTVYVLSKPIMQVLGTEGYFVSEPYLALAMLILFLNALYQIFNIGVCYAKKTVYITVSQGAALLINLSLCLILVPRFGILGAFLALLVGSLCANLIVFWIAQKVYPIRYDHLKIFELLALVCTVSIASFWVNNPLLKIAILLTYIVWSVFFRRYIDFGALDKLKRRFQNAIAS